MTTILRTEDCRHRRADRRWLPQIAAVCGLVFVLSFSAPTFASPPTNASNTISELTDTGAELDAMPAPRGDRGKDKNGVGGADPLTPRERAAKLLKSRKSAEVKRGLTLYGGFRDKASATVLQRFIRRSKNGALRVHAIGALAWRGNSASVTFLSGSHGVASRRTALAVAACSALVSIGDKSGTRALFRAVTDTRPAVVVAATHALAVLDPSSDSLPVLLAFQLDHADQDVRRQAIVALRKSSDTDSAAALARRIAREKEKGLRLEIYTTLGQLGGATAEKALRAVMADTNASSADRAAAADAVRTLTTKST